jgi:hypothetical protein
MVAAKEEGFGAGGEAASPCSPSARHGNDSWRDGSAAERLLPQQGRRLLRGSCRSTAAQAGKRTLEGLVGAAGLVLVGVQLEGEAAVRALDVVLGGGTLQRQDLVVVSRGPDALHQLPLLWGGLPRGKAASGGQAGGSRWAARPCGAGCCGSCTKQEARGSRGAAQQLVVSAFGRSTHLVILVRRLLVPAGAGPGRLRVALPQRRATPHP